MRLPVRVFSTSTLLLGLLACNGGGGPSGGTSSEVPGGSASCSGSSPTWTSTPDYASVSACVTSALRGDTINVSSGSVEWTDTLILTQGVKLLGTGAANLTIRTSADTMIAILP